MTDATPGVSIILTTYMGATRGFLTQAIQSVMDQTYPSFELIIVDDGSSDNTAQVCAPFLKDPRLKYVYQKNGGISSARNKGINHASHRYICFLDDDDLYEKTMIETLTSEMQKEENAECGLLYCAVKEIDTTGKIRMVHTVTESQNPYLQLLWGNCITTSALIVKKSVILEAGGFDENLLYCEDYDLWLRIAKKFAVRALNAPLVFYRVHPNSLSKNLAAMQKYQKQILDQHLKEAPQEIQKQKFGIYRRYHECCAAQFLGNGQFSEFRRQYQLAVAYGMNDSLWKFKYYISYLPPLYYLLKRLKRR